MSCQSCPTLCSPVDLAHQVPLSTGFPRHEYWSRLPCPLPGFLPDPGIGPKSLRYLALACGFFTTSPTWEAHLVVYFLNMIVQEHFSVDVNELP